MSTYDPSAIACHPGMPAEAQPYPPGSIVQTPGGDQVFIAVNRSGLAVTVARRERRIDVCLWPVGQVAAMLRDGEA